MDKPYNPEVVQGPFVNTYNKTHPGRLYTEPSTTGEEIVEGETVPPDSHNIGDIYGTLNRAFNCYRDQNAKKEEIKKRRKLKKLIKRQKKHHK